MANVYVNTLGVPRKARNGRIYAGNSFTSINRTEIVPSTTPPADEYKYPYGGIVTWRTGLTFDISRSGRPINGFFYESAATEITLSAAHATLDRIDVVYIDINSVVGVITGTPSATPQKPSIDPATQYELSFVEIPAAATEPAGVDEDVIYNENVEWTGSQSGTTVDFDSTTDPKVGSKCAEITNISHGDTITFTNATTLNVADYTSVSFWIKLKDTDFLGNFIEVYFKNNGHPVGKLVVVELDRGTTNWQFVSLNTADFEVPNGIFDGFTIRWHNSGATYAGLYLDYIKLQKGIELPASIDNYVTGVSWDEATGTLTLHRTGALGDITKVLTGINGDDGREVEISTDGGFIVWRYVGEVAWNNICPVPQDGADGTKPVQVTGLTLLAVNWVTDGSLKKYVLSHASITATSIVEVIPANASVAIVKAAEVLPETDSAAGSVSIWATNTPTGDISVTINIYETV